MSEDEIDKMKEEIDIEEKENPIDDEDMED
jgi:hypothetical protein